MLGCAAPGSAGEAPKAQEATDHPEVVLLTPPEGGPSGCGTLVAPNVVLTSAGLAKQSQTWQVTVPYAVGGRVGCRTRAMRVHPNYREVRVPGDPLYFRVDDEGVAFGLAVLILDRDIAIGKEFPTLYADRLYPIDTKLVVLCPGPGPDGALCKATTRLDPVRSNLNVYGGSPPLRPGSEGSPVFVRGREREIVAVVTRFALRPSRRQVTCDVYIPLTRAKRNWVLEQVKQNPPDAVAKR
jgi:hypothetical protein